MEIPEYLMGDNSDCPEAIFVVHTRFPRFVINLKNDEIKWLEEFNGADKDELIEQTQNYIREASEFYDRELARYADQD